MKTILTSILPAFTLLASPLAEDEAKTDAHGHAVESYKLDTCPVSGKKLGEMGEPHRIMHHGREIQMCCDDCEPKFRKDPDKYMRIMDDAPGPMAASLMPLKGAEFDTAFLKRMIQHHEVGIAMAKLAATQTERPELVAKAKELINEHTEEVAKMTTWLKDWQNETPGMMEGAPGMGMMRRDIDSLKNVRGEEFDRAFLNMMIHHHQGAVHMAKLVADRSEKAELKDYANESITDQTEEIQQFETWRSHWFPKEKDDE